VRLYPVQLCSCCHPSDGDASTRRGALSHLARGSIAALLAAGALRSTIARADDDVVRIGYLAIMDATALLVAHAKGYFEEAGLRVESPTLISS